MKIGRYFVDSPIKALQMSMKDVEWSKQELHALEQITCHLDDKEYTGDRSYTIRFYGIGVLLIKPKESKITFGVSYDDKNKDKGILVFRV